MLPIITVGIFLATFELTVKKIAFRFAGRDVAQNS
jgi:hypothetical protein